MLVDLPESCTAEHAVDVIGSLASRLTIPGNPPSIRLLRLWRSKHQLSKGDRRFTRKNLLEVLGIMQLRAEGMSIGSAAEKCVGLDEERLLAFIIAPPIAQADNSSAFAQTTLQLLAKGIIEQYRRVTLGAIVGHIDDRLTGIENTPTSLRQASARLARLYFEEGQQDEASSFHMLLLLCTRPLADWAPRAVSNLPSAGSAVLIDPDYRVPSEDCQDIAVLAEGVSLDDLVENHLHNDLKQRLAKLGDAADASYTSVREFIGRHPLATRSELRGLDAKPGLPNAAVEFVHSLYRPVHGDFATEGRIQRCHYCRGLVDRSRRCTLQGCREDHPQSQLAEPALLDDALIAQPEVLKYWVDPAREELRLYDALKKAYIPADLYPHSDRCDVAVGDHAGVDVKDYRDPVHLARKLNRGIGGLVYYERGIVAIADRRARNGYYIERLREQLSPENQQRLEVRSVSETIQHLKRDYKSQRGPRARQA